MNQLLFRLTIATLLLQVTSCQNTKPSIAANNAPLIEKDTVVKNTY